MPAPSPPTPVPFSITAILISRFLLELQEASQDIVRVDSDDPLHLSRDLVERTPSFISSIGGFINPDVLASQEDGVESLHVVLGSGGEVEHEEAGVQAAGMSQEPALSASV